MMPYGDNDLNPEIILCMPLANERQRYPDSKVHGANMGPIWGRHNPGGSHVAPMNFAILGRSFIGIHKIIPVNHNGHNWFM